MSHSLPGEHGSQMTLLVRSRSLRLRADAAMQRAAALRELSRGLVRADRGAFLLHPRVPLELDSAPAVPSADDAEDADTLQWYRVQVREMLGAGWTVEELADVGITDSLLRELGLHGME